MNEDRYFINIFKMLMNNGKKVSPRGEEVIELENFSFMFKPYVRFMNFEARKLNLNYIKKEFLWYLKGDKFDISICDHASLWKSLVNEDGSINSNYGQYVFGEINQFKNVIRLLQNDKDSRRASIVILQPYHLLSEMKDLPCTYSINFRIRDNKLNMTVHMRSQDAIYGLGNDLPAFSFIHEMIFIYLRDTIYAMLQYGDYCHVVDSFHVYKKHYGMINKIIHGDVYAPIDCPKINNINEVLCLLNQDDITISLEAYRFLFYSWLLNNKGL